VLQTRRVALRARKEGCANFFSQREKNPIKWVQSPISHRLKSKRNAPIKHHREQLHRHFFARITRIIHGVFVNDLILGRNERVLIRIDGFRRPKIFHSPNEKGAKKPKARAFVGFCVTYSERSQIRRRVLRPVLAETAREHVSRAMSETSASCSLVTHVCLCAFPVRFFGA